MTILKKLGFLAAFILPVLVVMGYQLGGWWNYTTFIFVFGFLPIADKLIGKDRENITNDEIKTVGQDIFFSLLLYVWAVVQTVLLIWAIYIVSLNQQTTSEYVGFLMGVMIVTGGIGITVAHELGHKTNKIDRLVSQFLLAQVCYTHFYIEHNRGHHVRVATPEDPATSRQGETFYAFWWRTVIGSWLSAWELEAKSLERKGKKVVSLVNTMVVYSLITLTISVIITLIFSLLANKLIYQPTVFFLLQSILAFSLLEAVNYIEHYGIVRKKVNDNYYERVNPLHSWNANELLTNCFLFQLQRHSDHHAAATKPYQTLYHLDESPQLPAGYPTMILCALFPPIWFAVMDSRLAQWNLQRLTMVSEKEI